MSLSCTGIQQISCRLLRGVPLAPLGRVSTFSRVSVVLAVMFCWLSPPIVAQSGTGGSREGGGLFHEPKAIAKAAAQAERLTREREYKDGFFVETGNMITGSGWVSLGPGYRHRVFGKRAVVTTSAAVSWRLYNMARASIDTPRDNDSPWSFGTTALYQDALQVNFFGVGNNTDVTDRSGYRLQSFDLDGHTAYTRGRITLQARAGWMPTIAVRPMAGRVPDNYPDVGVAFTDATAPGLSSQPSFLHADASATFDTRDQPGYARSGGIYSAAMAQYSDRDTGRFSFQSFQFQGVQYVPLVKERWTLALRAWGAFTNTSVGAGHVVPFYLMPNTGGRSTVRGFRDYRFYGPQMEVFSAESRWAIFEHLDAALFIDAGRVADRVADLGFSGLQQSVGAGIRFHTARDTVARLEVARSQEGWVLIFKTNEPFTRKTFTGNRTPTVPFVP